MKKERYQVAVVTSTRAEYGLLSPVLRALGDLPDIETELLVTGSHLSAELGNTVEEIEADGAPIAARLPILKFSNDRLGVAHTVGYTVELFADHFSSHRPDAVLLLGDRYEIFAVASAAAVLGIPIAHISGGDVTAGAQDEFFRHSISKMAKLHFPSCDASAKRLLRMGEEPFRICQVGGLGDENIRHMPRMGRKELEESIGFSLEGGFLLITFHPETAAEASPQQQMGELLAALDRFPKLRLLFTKANADAGGAEINAMMDAYCARRSNAAAYPSLGLRRYLSAMALCSAVVGNSSSGVVEAPSFQKPVVNIGERQAGREICANVICCPAREPDITAAIEKALSPAFEAVAKTARSPYNGGDTSRRIAQQLQEWLQTGRFEKVKEFYDGGTE